MLLSQLSPFDVVIVYGLLVTITHLDLDIVESYEIFKESLSSQTKGAGVPQYLRFFDNEIVHRVVSLFLEPKPQLIEAFFIFLICLSL